MLIISSLTERCYLVFTNVLNPHLGGPSGPTGMGKNETVKDLTKGFASFRVIFNCSSAIMVMHAQMFLSGLACTEA
jgi:hypothetical protein